MPFADRPTTYLPSSTPHLSIVAITKDMTSAMERLHGSEPAIKIAATMDSTSTLPSALRNNIGRFLPTCRIELQPNEAAESWWDKNSTLQSSGTIPELQRDMVVAATKWRVQLTPSTAGAGKTEPTPTSSIPVEYAVLSSIEGGLCVVWRTTSGS